MDTCCLSDDEFIDVENDSDNEEVQIITVNKGYTSINKYDERPMDVDSNNISSQQKSITIRNEKTTSNSRDEFANILLGIMKKMFSAKVVLERLPNPVVKKMQSTQKPILRDNIKKIIKPTETAFIHEGNAYKRICPKCRQPPAKRKTRQCLTCEIDLIYECQKCHKSYPITKYTRLLAHLDGKCFIRGYYMCSVCDFKTLYPSKLKSHISRLHPSVNLDKEILKWADIRKLPKSTLHKCSRCDKQFENHEFLNRHIPLCNKSQKILGAISNQQMRINKDFQKLIIRFCPKCQEDTKVYSSGVSSLQPCQSCGSTMKFKCLKCSKQYDDYCSIAVHARAFCRTAIAQKIHPRYTSGKTMDCPHCNKPFVQKMWLDKHLLRCSVLHRAPRRKIYHKHLKATCQNCNEVQNICDRRKHCLKCKSKLQFQCKTCDKHFTSDYDSWCEHLKMYFDLVKYECDDCCAGLISRRAFRKHLTICNTNLQCDLCNFKTKFKQNLQKHMLFKHPILQN